MLTGDLETAVSASIANDGQTTCSARIPYAAGIGLSDGLVGTPAVNFTADTDTGVYRPGANQLAVSCGGIQAALFAKPAAGGSAHRISLNNYTINSDLGMSIDNGSFVTARFYVADADGFSASNSVLEVGKNTSSGRSINAGGTVNASGADYAEYERKSAKCGDIAKGQIVGFDKDGNLTDKWDSALSFGIKSTDPSYVGGGAWGTAEALGKHRADKATVTTAYEAERVHWDRIAYSGKVPCNVKGASVGDYIIAVQDGDGISGKPTADPSFEEYRRAVGRVRSVMEDGRCIVAVIVH